MNLLAHAVCPGELDISVAELAATFGTTEAAVHRSLADRSVRATRRHPVELAVSAALECLVLGRCPAGELDVIIWLGDQVDGLCFQETIGADQAYLLCLAGECTEYASAMTVAQGLLAGSVIRILVGTGEHFQVRLTDSSPTEQNYRNILGDAGSAVLLGRGTGPLWLGAGFASRGEDWRYLKQILALRGGVAANSKLPFYGQIFRETVPILRTALTRCLAESRLNLEQIDYFCFPSIRLRNLVSPLLRLLGIPPAKLVAHSTFAHLGKSDFLLDMGILCGPEYRGHSALLICTSIGVIRCASFRL